MLSNDPHKKESANGNARWNVPRNLLVNCKAKQCKTKAFAKSLLTQLKKALLAPIEITLLSSISFDADCFMIDIFLVSILVTFENERESQNKCRITKL